MLEELDAHHGNDDAEGKLVLAVLREAAPLPVARVVDVSELPPLRGYFLEKMA